MCDYPITHKLARPIHKDGNWLYNVPLKCGKCLPCIQHRVQTWGFRLAQELKRSNTAYFVTLTYDTDHIPFKHGRMTLDKKDAVKFIKRLRQHHKERKNLSIEEVHRADMGI